MSVGYLIIAMEGGLRDPPIPSPISGMEPNPGPSEPFPGMVSLKIGRKDHLLTSELNKQGRIKEEICKLEKTSEVGR